MKVELRKLSEITPYENNPRQNDAAVVPSIREFGFRQPIVVDAEGVIVCGHTRYKAAQKMGLEKVPIELADLQAADFDLDLIGFSQDELAELLDPGVKDGLTDPDDVPEPPDEAVTQPGDLWILGDHRLLCGDSSKPEDVDRLLGGATIQLVNTDPPYNVRVEPRSNNARVLDPGRGFYIWGGYANCANYPPFLKKHKLYFSQAIIWDKQHPVLTRKDFMGAHEWCFYGWKEGAAHQYLGPHNATDLWHVKKINPNKMVHLTEKPVELASTPRRWAR